MEDRKKYLIRLEEKMKGIRKLHQKKAYSKSYFAQPGLPAL